MALVALIFLPLVLCTATLSGMFPNGGGFYTYAKEGLNTTAGYMGGLLYVIGYTFALGVEVLALRGMLISVLGSNWFLSQVMLFNIVCIAVFVLLNMMSFKLFSKMLNSINHYQDSSYYYFDCIAAICTQLAVYYNAS